MEVKKSQSNENGLDYYDAFKFSSIASAIISINGLITDCNNQFCLYNNSYYIYKNVEYLMKDMII